MQSIFGWMPHFTLISAAFSRLTVLTSLWTRKNLEPWASDRSRGITRGFQHPLSAQSSNALKPTPRLCVIISDLYYTPRDDWTKLFWTCQWAWMQLKRCWEITYVCTDTWFSLLLQPCRFSDMDPDLFRCTNSQIRIARSKTPSLESLYMALKSLGLHSKPYSPFPNATTANPKGPVTRIQLF